MYLAAMEPAPEGGKNHRRAERCSQPRVAAAMEPASEGGKNPVQRAQVGGELIAAMEPAPEGGKNPLPKCTPADLPL